MINCNLLRCKWHNGYCHWKWTRRTGFIFWTRFITFPMALRPLVKVWIQLRLLTISKVDFGVVTGLETRKPWIQTSYSLLKNWNCVTPCRDAGIWINPPLPTIKTNQKKEFAFKHSRVIQKVLSHPNSNFCLNFCKGEAHTKGERYETNLKSWWGLELHNFILQCKLC